MPPQDDAAQICETLSAIEQRVREIRRIFQTAPWTEETQPTICRLGPWIVNCLLPGRIDLAHIREGLDAVQQTVDALKQEAEELREG